MTSCDWNALPEIPLWRILLYLNDTDKQRLGSVSSTMTNNVLKYENRLPHLRSRLNMCVTPLTGKSPYLESELTSEWQAYGKHIGHILRHLSQPDMEKMLEKFVRRLSRCLNTVYNNLSSISTVLWTFLDGVLCPNYRIDYTKMWAKSKSYMRIRLIEGYVKVLNPDCPKNLHNEKIFDEVCWRMQITDFRNNTYNFI